MKPAAISFDEFPELSKTAWLARIEKELKGLAPDSFRWELEPGIQVNPFSHPDDQPVPPDPISTQVNQWRIAEQVQDGAQALEALQMGTEALIFDLPSGFKPSALEALLEGIHLDFISLHLAGAGAQENPGGLLHQLVQIAAAKGLSPAVLEGSIAYDPAAHASIVDWRYLAELLEYGHAHMPAFRLISIDYKGSETPTEALVHALKAADHYLRQLTQKGIDPAICIGALQFEWAIGTAYFVEIARLRALKLLWFNLLKAWSLPLQAPRVKVCFQHTAYGDDLYTNMIRASTMAMSAVIGGADTLVVRPFDEGRAAESQSAPAFGRRIARNVQHLLKMESFMDQLADPSAGSYYIENLTHQIAEQAWEKFTEA